jgi:hypothetical protein
VTTKWTLRIVLGLSSLPWAVGAGRLGSSVEEVSVTSSWLLTSGVWYTSVRMGQVGTNSRVTGGELFK